MRRPTRVLLLLALAAPACTRSPLADGLPDNVDCTGCHGQNNDPTPPPAVDGTMSTKHIGVGAHLPHMRGSDLAGPVACTECHVLPPVANGTDHPDPLGAPARIVFGPLARKEPASPGWDREARTCAGTYCHGVTLRGGKERPAPVWTRVDGSQIKCDSCHGNPPPDTHPQMNECEVCHGDVMGPDGVIKNPSLHVDGNIQISF